VIIQYGVGGGIRVANLAQAGYCRVSKSGHCTVFFWGFAIDVTDCPLNLLRALVFELLTICASSYF